MNTTADLAILVPLWKRTHRLPLMLESVIATMPEAEVVAVVSRDDPGPFPTCGRVLRASWPGGSPGDYARKINLAYRMTDASLLFLAADDIVFHLGWFEACLAKLEPGIGVVGTNDLGNPATATGELSTHSLVLRDYADEFGTIDEPGKILFEGYQHEWVDDELVGTAKFRHAYAHAPDAHVEHLHPSWQKAEYDEIYRRDGERMAASRGLYDTRRALWGQ